jgi:3-methyladenine DNA glycosylase/8-oxoguanine DNA glycosylase
MQAILLTKQVFEQALVSLKELEKMSELWKPWRAVAAMIFWHYYLNS